MAQSPTPADSDELYSIIQRHIADINRCIVSADVTTFASELLQASLITPVSHETAIEVTARSAVNKIGSLTSEVSTKLKTTNDRELFDKFVGIIKKRNKKLASILSRECSRLAASCGELDSSSDVPPIAIHDKTGLVATSSDTPRSKTDVGINEKPLFELTPTFKKDNDPLPPPNDESMREAVKEFAKKVRVVIQTCNCPEYYAALKKLESPRIKDQEFTKPVKYPHQVLSIVVGTFADFDAAIIKTEQGSKCKNELEAVFNKDSIIFTSAKLLLGLGVCYGLQKNLKFADVLVGKEIDAAQIPKLAGTMETRAKLKEKPKSVQKLFCEDADMWDDFCVCEEPSKRIAKAFVGRLFSASVLINDPGVKQGLEDSAQQYLGGEMEGWAQIEYTPEHVKSIIIKGIVDFADGTKDKTWQLTAAMAAVDYAHFKLIKAGYINFDEI